MVTPVPDYLPINDPPQQDPLVENWLALFRVHANIILETLKLLVDQAALREKITKRMFPSQFHQAADECSRVPHQNHHLRIEALCEPFGRKQRERIFEKRSRPP
jgi:hypothetical protein